MKKGTIKGEREKEKRERWRDQLSRFDKKKKILYCENGKDCSLVGKEEAH